MHSFSPQRDPNWDDDSKRTQKLIVINDYSKNDQSKNEVVHSITHFARIAELRKNVSEQ